MIFFNSSLNDSLHEITALLNGHFNPILDWCKKIVFMDEKTEFKIERDKKFGGDLSYYNYSELERDFADGKLHPQDLKKATAEYLIKRLTPIRKHFNTPKINKMREELESFTVTR